MGIYNNDVELYNKIESALKEAIITIKAVPSISPTTGEIVYNDTTYPLLPTINSTNAMVTFNNPTNPEFELPYGSSEAPAASDGMRKIIEVITKETLNYIIANAQLAAKERYNLLEQDYNDLFEATKSVISAVNAAYAANTALIATDPVPGTIKPYVTYADMAGFMHLLSGHGGPTNGTRYDLTTETLINNNEKINETPVDIK